VSKLDRPLDVTLDAVRNLLIDGYSRYEQALKQGDAAQHYWDGYIRALYRVIELEDE
jgi:hypothetical protein